MPKVISKTINLKSSLQPFPDAPIKSSLAQFLYINWRPAGREWEGAVEKSVQTPATDLMGIKLKGLKARSYGAPSERKWVLLTINQGVV